jgi:hypothetical protein
LCINGKLDLAKYGSLWLNQRTFNTTSISSINFQLLLPQPQTNSLFTVGNDPLNTFKDDDVSFGDTFGDETQNLGDDDSEEEVRLSELASNGASKDGKLTSQFVAEKATNLVCLA